MTTRMLSRAGGGELVPLPAEEARERLAAIYEAWQVGMTAPLPLARDTAFAWLEKGGSPHAMTRWMNGAADEEAEKARTMQDVVGYIEALVASAEGGGFAVLAERLYAPLLRAVKKDKKSKDKGGKA